MLEPKNLQKYSLFGGILEDQISKIIPLMVEERYGPGEVIIKEGIPNDKILFIVKGRVSIIKGSTLIYDLAEGNTFGEMEVLDVMPCAATIRAVTDVTVMSMSNISLRKIYKSDIKAFALLLMNLARDLSRRLRVANEIMVDGKMYELYSASLFTGD
ncbi:MAG: cyclic nucleotide-binding domain-containing protein [Treponema sp.]|jgi:CRP-like cAMP-binding protein|nr:cyclic nucleotide-binding domain-containing protein [Treponema sp.]